MLIVVLVAVLTYLFVRFGDLAHRLEKPLRQPLCVDRHPLCHPGRHRSRRLRENEMDGAVVAKLC